MILVVEPTYADGEHGPVNSAILQAVMLCAPRVVFACTDAQHAAIVASGGPDGGFVRERIEVLPPGGVSLRRMRAQWRAIDLLLRAHPADIVLLLSAGPETLFVARGLVARHPALRVFAVMHGNLATVTGWRSRDPRRRMIDLRSGLAVARHRRIRLIVLEDYIRDAASGLRLGHDFLVWPHPTVLRERPLVGPWQPGARLRVSFVGTATRQRGFLDFLALRQSVGDRHDWALAGTLAPDVAGTDLHGLSVPAGRLSRTDYLAALRRTDYAFLGFGAAYSLTASGALIDCITQRKPLLGLSCPQIDHIQNRYGPIGHVCADLATLRRLIQSDDILRDSSAYARFQRTMDDIHADRVPAGLARRVAGDLQLPVN